MKNSNLLWLVGFFEGEGSCGCYRKTCYVNGKKYVYPRGNLSACIAQKDPTIIRWIQKTVGYGSIGLRANRKSSFGSSVWCWYISHKNAQTFLRMIRPFIKIPRRRYQIDKALKAYEAK